MQFYHSLFSVFSAASLFANPRYFTEPVAYAPNACRTTIYFSNSNADSGLGLAPDYTIPWHYYCCYGCSTGLLRSNDGIVRVSNCRCLVCELAAEHCCMANTMVNDSEGCCCGGGRPLWTMPFVHWFDGCRWPNAAVYRWQCAGYWFVSTVAYNQKRRRRANVFCVKCVYKYIFVFGQFHHHLQFYNMS